MIDVRAASTAAAQTGIDRPSGEAEQTQLARLAHEFEAMFMSEMLRGMRESMLSDQEEEGLGNETMTDTFDAELGLSLSKAGGMGLAKVMLEALVKRGTDPSAAAVPLSPHVVAAYTAASTAARSLTPSLDAVVPGTDAGPVASLGEPLGGTPISTPLPGPVTSPFGWRADPFSGRPQFHAGTDVRMAYGQNVQAVAPGRVTSAGERSGYGLTVVIDHGNGLETRYAHLSAATVREGDTVEAGQVVAQSGSSGRSTGPHLHLEARQNGRAIEVGNLLKVQGLAADSYADGTHARSGQ